MTDNRGWNGGLESEWVARGILMRAGRFFNDLLSEGPTMTFWHAMRSFYDGDGYPALPLYFRFFDVAVSFLLPYNVKLIRFC